MRMVPLWVRLCDRALCPDGRRWAARPIMNSEDSMEAHTSRQRGAADRTLAGLPLRLLVTIAEEPIVEGGASPGTGRRLALAAVVANPLAASDEDNLVELVELGEELGRYLAERILRATEGEPIAAVGKAVIVGQDGELEHAAAIVGAGFDAAVRKVIGGWRLDRPSPKKLGGPGAPAVVTLFPVADASSGASASSRERTQEPMEVRVPGRPRDDELVVVLAAEVTP